MPSRLDTLRVPLILYPAGFAGPDVLVLDRVAVFRRHSDIAVRERGADFARPSLEARTVRGGGAVREHEVGKMAVFVRENVEEAVGVVDDLFCELDGGVMAVCCRWFGYGP